jgi:beta-lactamase class A
MREMPRSNRIGFIRQDGCPWHCAIEDSHKATALANEKMTMCHNWELWMLVPMATPMNNNAAVDYYCNRWTFPRDSDNIFDFHGMEEKMRGIWWRRAAIAFTDMTAPALDHCRWSGRWRVLPMCLLAMVLGACATASARPYASADWNTLPMHIRSVADQAPGHVAVMLIDLGSGRHLGVNEHVRMHAASTMKVPVMLELYRQADAGRFSLTDKILVRNRFTSIADGSTYSLDPADDSETALYQLVGDKVTINDLIKRMITRSSNLATDNVIGLVGSKNVQATLDAMGAGGMHVLRGVEDIPAYRRGMNNTTTAAALARVLAVIARCAAPGSTFRLQGRLAPLTHDACRQMVGILKAQHFNTMIPAGLPAGVTVAHKTGEITKIHHDAAIVYPANRPPYVLVVMTHGIADPDQSAHVVAHVSRIVWDALVPHDTDRGG